MINEQNIKNILSSGRELTQEEQRLVDEWYEGFEQYDDLTFENEIHKNEVRNSIKSNIDQHIEAETKVLPLHFPQKKYIKWAAAAAIFLISFLTYNYFQNNNIDDETEWITEKVASNDMSQLIKFEDGSTAQLFTGSIIKYPKKFQKSNRKVELIEGTAFFNVTPDKNKPFTVHSGAINTTVLGTSFQIKHIPNLQDIQVYVQSGKVKVTDTAHSTHENILLPDDVITFNKEQQSFKLSKADSKELTSWRNGTISFTEASFEEVIYMIGKAKNISISYNPEQFKHQSLNFNFDVKDSTNDILNILAKISNAEYRKNGEEVIFSKK